MKTLYMIWMVLGVVGFPASVGWLLHRWQKYVKAVTSDAEKLEQRKRLMRSAIVALAFLLILVGWIAAVVLMTQGEKGVPISNT